MNNNKSGMALVLVLFSSLMLMIMVAIALLFVEKHSRLSVKTTARTKGYYLAEAAVFRAMYELQQGGLVWTGADISINNYLSLADRTLDGKVYSVDLLVADNDGDGILEVNAAVEYIGLNQF